MTKRKPKSEHKRLGPKPKFDPIELAAGLIKHFNVEPYTTGYEEVASNKEKLRLERKVPCDFPTVAGFCITVPVSKSRLYDLASKREDKTEELVNPELSDALKRAKDYQEHILVVNTMHGLYEKTFAIFAAKNLIDWRDTQYLDHSTKGESLNRRVDSETGKLVARILKHKADAEASQAKPKDTTPPAPAPARGN